jgi:hypothetical protein
MLTLEQIKFCAEECERQQSGEISVYNMCKALDFMVQVTPIVNNWELAIHRLGRIIEPKKNANGYRKTPVIIGGEVLDNADVIPHQMSTLLQWISETKFDRDTDLVARDLYFSFEKIHPFIDGNGRVGAILYNYIRGTIDDPVAPPDVFNKE